MMRRLAMLVPLLSALLAALLLPGVVHAQVDPTLAWHTIGTGHFRVHFSPGLDSVARRAAGSAERAWGRLSAELHAPRGPVDLVIADNVDYTNGNATVFPVQPHHDLRAPGDRRVVAALSR